jgi:hypothetical protein
VPVGVVFSTGAPVGLDEEDAYCRMRKLASDNNRKLVDVARTVLAAEEVFGPLEAEARRA